MTCILILSHDDKTSEGLGRKWADSRNSVIWVLFCSDNARMKKGVSRIITFEDDLIMFHIYIKRRMGTGYLLRVPCVSIGFLTFLM